MTHPLSSADISIFSSEIKKFCYIRKYRCRFHFGAKCLIFLNIFGSLKIILINMVTILMISAKLATPSLLKIKIFQNRDYEVKILDYDATNEI